MRRHSASGCSRSTPKSTLRSAPARFRTSASGLAQAVSAFRAAPSGSPRSVASPPRCRCTASAASRRVLEAMRRTYARERYLRLVDELRAAVPELALTTDIIVGFPGETEDDFRETIEVVEDVGFDGAYTFVYSPRQGTEAAVSPDQVPDGVKHERIERLVEAVQRVAHARNQERIGRVEEVLVEGPSRTEPSLLRGRTRRNTTVNFSGDAAPGELVAVTIASATSTTLRGTHLAAAAA